jgi:hypothetical protein
VISRPVLALRVAGGAPGAENLEWFQRVKSRAC